MASNSFGSGIRLSNIPETNFRGIFIGTLGPEPYTRERVEKSWDMCFGSTSGSSFSQSSYSAPSASLTTTLIENYGTKNFALCGLSRDYMEVFKKINSSVKFTKLRDGKHGYIFPKESLDAVQEFLAQSQICVDITKKEKKESVSVELPKPPTTIVSITKNSFGNYQIAGTECIVLRMAGGAIILVGKQDTSSNQRGESSVIPLRKEEREHYRHFKKLIVLDEDNIEALSQKYATHKDFFMRMVYDQNEEPEDE
jgi:hypothetical protein